LINGPAILEDPEATIVIPPAMSATVSSQGHIIIDTGVNP
jgi:N-methylhydantoinase A/oxoprolinase/acetone carboxylase beta subunit